MGYNYKKVDIQCEGNVWFQKLSIPPPRKRFFLRPPPPPHHLSGNSSQASYIYLNFWAFENPLPSRNFQSLLWGEYGYFLELHYEEHCEEVVYWYHMAEILLYSLLYSISQKKICKNNWSSLEQDGRLADILQFAYNNHLWVDNGSSLW